MLNMIDQNHNITLRDLGDEYQRMDIVLDDTTMIQQNIDENGYARKIAQPFRKRYREKIISNKKLHPRAVLKDIL
ncbi:hypothetical protein ACTXT7_003041 [Hymenolepis weldensis]